MFNLSCIWRLPYPQSIGDDCQPCLSKERRQAFGSRFLPLLKQMQEELQQLSQSLTEACIQRSLIKILLGLPTHSQPHFKEKLQPNFVTFQLKNH